MILNVFIVLISVLVLAVAFYLYRSAAGNVSFGCLNMLSYAFYVLLIQGWCGAVIVTLNQKFLVYDPTIFNSIVGDRTTQIELWAWLMWMVVGVPLGAMLVNLVVRPGSMSARMQRYRAAPLQIGWHEKPLFYAFVLMGTMILAATFYRIQQMGELPLLNILSTGDVNSTLVLRRNYRISTGFGTEILSSVYSSTIIVWMCYVSYAVASTTGLKRWWWVFGVTFTSSLLLLVVNTTIAPTFIFLLGFMIVRSMLRQKVFRLVEVASALGLLVLMQVVFKNQDRNIVHVLQEAIVGRIMTGQLLGFYMVRNVFPDLEPFIGFASTGNAIHEVFGLPTSPSYGIVTMQHYNALGVEAGTAGHMTTVFMGEAWANFGYIGLVLAPLWVGGFVQLVNLWFLARSKTMTLVGLYATLATTNAFHSDFVSFYYPAGTILVLVGVGTVLLLAWLIRGNTQSLRQDRSRPLEPWQRPQPGPRSQ